MRSALFFPTYANFFFCLLHVCLASRTNNHQPLIEGVSVGQKILHGEVCVVTTIEEIDNFRPGCILVSEITDPDWVPIMRQAGKSTQDGKD